MFHRKHGHIVSLASIAGKTGLAGAVDYCPSKFAAVGLMEAIRQELSSVGSNGIQFTTVCPSLITTGMFEGVKFRLVTIIINFHSVKCTCTSIVRIITVKPVLSGNLLLS